MRMKQVGKYEEYLEFHYTQFEAGKYISTILILKVLLNLE